MPSCHINACPPIKYHQYYLIVTSSLLHQRVGRGHLISPTNAQWETLHFTNKCPVGDTSFHQQIPGGRHFISPTSPGSGWGGDTSFHQQMPGGRHFISPARTGGEWGGETSFHQQMLGRRHFISPTNTRWMTLHFTNKPQQRVGRGHLISPTNPGGQHLISPTSSSW